MTKPLTVSYRSVGSPMSSSSLDLVEVDDAAHEQRPVVHSHNIANILVIFVKNVAHDLLEQILDRDNARRAPVFVDDDRHVDLVLLEVAEHFVDRALTSAHDTACAAASSDRTPLHRSP